MSIYIIDWFGTFNGKNWETTKNEKLKWNFENSSYHLHQLHSHFPSTETWGGVRDEWVVITFVAFDEVFTSNECSYGHGLYSTDLKDESRIVFVLYTVLTDFDVFSLCETWITFIEDSAIFISYFKKPSHAEHSLSYISKYIIQDGSRRMWMFIDSLFFMKSHFNKLMNRILCYLNTHSLHLFR